MLDKLRISGYRQLENLKIAKLGHVNLITGKNNVGKRSLLEAIRIYSTKGSRPVILEILESRDELLLSPAPTLGESSREVYLDFSQLFFDRPNKTEDIHAFYIGPSDENNNLMCVSLKHEYPTQSEDSSMMFFNESELIDNKDIARARPFIEIRFETNVLDRFLTEVPLRQAKSFFRRIQADSSPSPRPCIFVPATGMGISLLEMYWDRIALTEAENDVLEALRIIEPNAERITFVTLRQTYGRSPMVKLKNAVRPVPISSLGDGMRHIFTTALALVSAKNGILLLDEIENGIHYSVQLKMWELILSTAQRLNVQVFSTTHSWDCIEAFQQASRDNKDADGVLVRLDRKESGITATVFDESELDIATKARIEVR